MHGALPKIQYWLYDFYQQDLHILISVNIHLMKAVRKKAHDSINALYV